MKLLITKSKPREEDEDYYVIDKFEKFSELTKDELLSVDEIKMDEYLLSMSCLFWLVDYDLSALGHIHFSISLEDRERASYLRGFIHKYMRKYENIKANKVDIPEDS